MTMAFSSPASSREQLGAGDVRRGLTAMLRRWIPPQEVEDVAQTVLCDALAARERPTDPEELRRWLAGIARHKVADFHRRAARASARMSAEPTELAAVRPAAFEEREVLASLHEAVQSRRDAETMGWLVREHGGERLADIASENGIAAPVVRQRVARLRRALRSRWAGLFGLVALVAGVAALAMDRSAPAVAITPDPVVATTAPVAPASASPAEVFQRELEGDWAVQTVTPKKTLSAGQQRILDAEGKGALLHVRGKRVELQTRSLRHGWTIRGIEPSARGFRVEFEGDGVRDAGDVVLRRDARGPVLEVTLHGARFGGTVVFRRPIS